MKQYLCALALLLVLSAGTLAVGHIRVNSARDKVEMAETVLAGDPAAAAGLTITYKARDRYGSLWWDTSFTPGSTEQAETAFRFSAAGEEEDYPQDNNISLDCAYDSFGISGTIRKGDYAGWLIDPVFDVASRTPDGEIRTETVRLADYYEYYPMTLSARRGDVWESSTTLSNGWLNRYFRLQVAEQCMVDVTVEKNGGEIVRAEMSRSGENSIDYLWQEGVAAENGVYLIAQSFDADGRPDNRLQCPDGPGIHYIPANSEVERGSGWLDLSQIRLFYPTGGAEPLHLTLSADETKLLLYTCEADTLVLTVIDIGTGEVLQRLELMEMEDTYSNVLDREDLHLVWLDTGDFCLLEERDGVFQQALGGLFDGEVVRMGLLDYYYAHTAVLAWDGRRMALAAASQYCGYSHYGYIIGAGVWDADGLCFLGTYDYGVGRDPITVHNFLQYVSSYTPLSISFA